ncbi:hypothetical protein C1H46_034710 [Malus baccata]|uniref:Uncharacterized protein n=1 Tax=Malus baccata TaxID=106549 RepID=A0A540KZS8_MALBA|nr:hypothetical protein C1H46_034710 [Malus baccata]
MHTQNNMMAAPPSSSYRHIFLPEPKFVEQSLDPHSNRRKTGNRELRRVLTSSNMENELGSSTQIPARKPWHSWPLSGPVIGFRFEAYDLSVKTLLYRHLQALSVYDPFLVLIQFYIISF